MIPEERNCANCAVSFVIQPPRIATSMNDKTPTARPVRICRLNPPELVQQPNGTPVLTQPPVMDGHVCWSWKPPGTLPGDASPVPVKM